MRALERQRMVGWLAFLGLAFHLLLSFGHHHGDSCRHEADCSEFAYEVGFQDRDNCDTAVCPADHESEDDCLICRTTALLGFSPLPSPLTLALPDQATISTACISTAPIVDGRAHQAFRARAPPVSA